MEYSIIHLSDIHFIDEESKNFILDRASKIVEIIHSVAYSTDVLIVVSGDIAQSGKQEEYQVASVFFSNIKTQLEERGKKVEFVFSPGNHDFDIRLNSTVRKFFLKDSWPNAFDKTTSEIYNLLLEPQKHFFDFSESLSSVRLRRDHFITELHINSLKINIINSAMSSDVPESKGGLFLPLGEIEKIKRDPSKLNLTLLHHPNSWFHNSISTQLKLAISNISDIVITGHEHSNDNFEKRDMGSQTTEFYFEGGVLQNLSKCDESSFSIFKINKAKIETTVASWNQAEECYALTSLNSVMTSSHSPLGLSLKQPFIEYLNDPGPGIIHSRVRNLCLKDFYIFPQINLRKNSLNRKETTRTALNSAADIVHLFNEANKVVISGEDSSGKTSLAKVSFATLLECGYAPVLLNGRELTSLNEVHFSNKLDEKIKNSFSSLSLEQFKQIDIGKRVLIFDNADQARGRNNIHLKIFELSEKFFSKTMLIVSNEFDLELDVFVNLSEQVGDSSYERYRIQPFGYHRRADLLKKWLLLGIDFEKGEDTFKMSQVERLLDSYVLEFQIPKYPYFIICLLQQVETEKDFSLKCASNAKMFEMMVTYALSHGARQNFKIQTKHNYLCALSFYMYGESKDQISNEELFSFHQEYCKKNDLDMDFEALIAELVDSKVVFFDEVKFSFKYEYFKYYYVAVHLSKNKNSPLFSETIARVVNEIHIYENANILTFLSLFNNDPEIIMTTIKKLNDCFSGLKEGSFAGVANVIQELADISLVDFEEKEKELEEKRKEEDHSSEVFGNKDYDESDCVYQLGYCIRVMKIVGQILKNGFDTISPEQKKKIVEEVFRLGLRMVELFRKTIQDNKLEIVQYFASHIKKNNNSMPAYKVYEGARKHLAVMVFYSLYGIISNVSKSIGTEDLKITYDKAFLDDDGNQLDLENIAELTSSINYFKTQIELENFKDFPTEKIEELVNTFGSNGFLMTIIQTMVETSLVTVRKDNKKLTPRACELVGLDSVRVARRQLLS